MNWKTTHIKRHFLLLLIGIAFISNVSAQKNTPNIILIMADDMGKECIGAYGSTYKTPNIDKLAKEGLKFNYAFSQPLCTPSRVQIMTGKYNYKNYSQFGHLNRTRKHLRIWPKKRATRPPLPENGSLEPTRSFQNISALINIVCGS